MRHAALALVLFLLAGCCSTAEFDPPPPGDPLAYLVGADPNAVSTADLTSAVSAAEARLFAATVDGVVWPRSRSSAAQAAPDIFGSGGDSALFSGVATATWAWRYKATGAGLPQLAASVEGLHLLTHVTGSPGVVARCALPLARAGEFGWPWPHREPFVGERAGYGYYTRATRDQLTGLIFGLAVAWTELKGDPAAATVRARVELVAHDLHARLEADGWRLLNEVGENDTSADDVDGILRLGLEALVAAMDGTPGDVPERLRDLFGSWLEGIEAWTNRFNHYDGYYAFNLRAMRSGTIYLLAPDLDPSLRPELREYARSTWWRYVEGHRSAWFDAMWMLISGEDRKAQALYSLKSLSLRPPRGYGSPLAGQEQAPGLLASLANCTEGLVVDPHLRKPTGYTTWQKEPWDVGEPEPDGLLEDIGLSLTSAYWLYRRAAP